MKSELKVINPQLTNSREQAKASLSFRNFHEYLSLQTETETTVNKYLFKFILDQFKNHPTWLEEIPAAATAQHTFLYELIYASVVPAMSDEKDNLWGLSLPLAPSVFYGTDSFYNLLKKRLDAKMSGNSRFSKDEKINQWHYSFVYSFILQHVYELAVLPHNEFTYSYVEEESGMLKYSTIKSDTRFATVRVIGDLPDIDLKKITGDVTHVIEYLKQHIPLNIFHFEGFSILSVHDTTSVNVIENIRNAIVDQNPRELIATYQEILTLLKSLVGYSNVHFGLLPLLEVNRHLVVPYDNLPFSYLVKTARSLSIQEEVFLQYLSEYKADPKLQFYHVDDVVREDTPFSQIFYQTGIKTLVLIPVFHNNQVVGILEVHTDEPTLVSETSLSLLEQAVPLVSQLLQKSIHEFHGYIDHTIKDVFTSIQPSVEWKFKEVVWNHMKELRFERNSKLVPHVMFAQVYPLYGAIDIRNSTVERNRALKEDLSFYIDTLLLTLEQIKTRTALAQTDELLDKSRVWNEKISNNLITIDEVEFNDFITSEIDPYLLDAQITFPQLSDTITDFREATDDRTGEAFAHRRSLEACLQKVILEISHQVDNFREELQPLYPFYFEKFRTDGIEYDIYVGQSIAPEKIFNHTYVSTFRLMQIKSMARVVRLTHTLLPTLATPLQTTQLIFINPSPIDISFRNDERRFDVEGAYNIRYQVIKKRIDKVNIKNTSERLTQPDKIALVYYNNLEAEEYKRYINQLQEEKILNDDLEELELEELQGITGLKAMRVGVRSID